MTRDAFDVGSVDKRFIANPAPEPFGQLLPGQQIQHGDIMLDLSEKDKGWQWVQGSWIGMEAPKTNIVFARLTPPEGMRMLGDDDQEVIAGDRFWDGMQWVEFERRMSINEAGVIAGELTGGSIFIAKQGARPFQITVPAHHRLMWIGDVVRRGDKLSLQGDTRWSRVDDSLKGSPVPAPSEANQFIRYIRPVSMQASNWYVDSEKGKPVANGGPEDPFDNLENAQNIIEATFKQAGRSPQGVIWDSAGKPLLCYDPPEPAAHEEVGARPQAPPEFVYEETEEIKPVAEGVVTPVVVEEPAPSQERALLAALAALCDAEEAIEKARAAVKKCL